MSLDLLIVRLTDLRFADFVTTICLQDSVWVVVLLVLGDLGCYDFVRGFVMIVKI